MEVVQAMVLGTRRVLDLVAKPTTGHQRKGSSAVPHFGRGAFVMFETPGPVLMWPLRRAWCFVRTVVRSPILDGFFPCGECREFVASCKHYGRRPGRPHKEVQLDDAQMRIRTQAIRAVERRCQGCLRKSNRHRVRPVTYVSWDPAMGLQWDNLVVLCPRCYAFVKGFDIAAIALEPWAPPMLAQFVNDREREGLPL